MSISILFLFMYLQQATGAMKREAVSILLINSSELARVIQAFVPQVFIVVVLVIVYSVQFYIKSRLKDYGMLVLLGIREKDMKKYIVLEYVLSGIFSCAAGLVLGNVLSYAVARIMKSYLGETFVASVNMFKVYRITLIMCTFIIAGALFGIAIFLEEKGVTELIYGERYREKRNTSKVSLIYLGVGIVLCTAGVVIAAKVEGLEKIAEGLLCIGVLVSVMFGMGYLLERYRNSGGYLKKILVCNQFYHCFNKNKIMILVQVLIGIIFLNLTFNGVWETLPLEKSEYPNNFVCTTSQGSGFLKEFERKFGGENISFPFVWVDATWGEVRIGIRLSDYNCFFDSGETLKRDEIISLRSSDEMWSLIDGEQKGNLTRYIHLGEHTDAVEGGKRYKVKWEKDRDILGVGIGGGRFLFYG